MRKQEGRYWRRSRLRDLLPHGGTTECWSRHAGYPDLAEAAAR